MARSDPAMAPLPGQLEPTLPSEEQQLLRALSREFASTEVAPQATSHDHGGTLNVSLMRRTSEVGLLATTIPSGEGGAGTLESHQKSLTRDLTRALSR